MSEKIDFVITWVDGRDKNWQREKKMYTPDKTEDDRDIRYRDWDTLKYWFRGVEKNASWVNKVHFITWGHLPEWLNTKHPKINIVKHEDFIPLEYLPTFNSRVIELNFHRIVGLSDKFVYFNDDMFLLENVRETDFFKGDLPCDSLIMNALSPTNSTYISTLFNNIKIINAHFTKKQLLKKNFFKLFNFKYGTRLFRTFLLSPWEDFTGFYDPHLPTPYLKNTFNKVWELETENLKKTCSYRFRNNNNVNHFLFRYWQLVEGNFVPIRSNGRLIRLGNNDLDKVINQQKNKMVCLNDDSGIEEERLVKENLHRSFLRKFPYKSNYEK